LWVHLLLVVSSIRPPSSLSSKEANCKKFHKIHHEILRDLLSLEPNNEQTKKKKVNLQNLYVDLVIKCFYVCSPHIHRCVKERVMLMEGKSS
jgi:hypothetical protein